MIFSKTSNPPVERPIDITFLLYLLFITLLPFEILDFLLIQTSLLSKFIISLLFFISNLLLFTIFIFLLISKPTIFISDIIISGISLTIFSFFLANSKLLAVPIILKLCVSSKTFVNCVLKTTELFIINIFLIFYTL